MSFDKHEGFLQAAFIAVLIVIISSAAFGAQDRPLAEVLAEFIQNAAAGISQQISNKEEFMQQFALFKEQKDSELGPLLDQIGLLVKEYAENQDGLKESSDKLLQDFDALSQQLNQLESQYPQFQEVEQILKPHMDGFIEYIKNEFPTLETNSPAGSPWDNFFKFFQEAEARNSLGLGQFFRVEFTETEVRSRELQELINEFTIQGIAGRTILFQEITKYKNDIQVYHRIIENDQVTEETVALEDISVYHGLPDKMRNDGVDERMVRYVEENIKLLNFHLIDAFQQQGLVIDIDHPQVNVPPGYAPSEFITNLMQILLDLTPSVPVSPT